MSARRPSRLTAKVVRELIDYDPITGGMWWRVDRHGKAKAGMWAKQRGTGGYHKVKVFGVSYASSHIAWLHHHGRWPTRQVDHKNTDQTDDSIDNLREATPSQNSANRRRPQVNGMPRGVSLIPSGRFRAAIKIDGRPKHLGVFDTPDEASAAFNRAAIAQFGEFARFD